MANPAFGTRGLYVTLVRRLRMGIFAALYQRIATRYQLRPMDLAESAAYLRHKLALAGRTDPLFADDAVARLHKASLGLPRALDNLARDALIAAADDGRALVDDACAKRAVAEAVSECPSGGHPQRGMPIGPHPVLPDGVQMVRPATPTRRRAS